MKLGRVVTVIGLGVVPEIFVRILLERKPVLAKLRLAHDHLRLFPRGLERRKKNRHQYGYDGDNYEQFD